MLAVTDGGTKDPFGVGAPELPRCAALVPRHPIDLLRSSPKAQSARRWLAVRLRAPVGSKLVPKYGPDAAGRPRVERKNP